jgi:sulfur carrier protein
MELIINGKPEEVAGPATLKELVALKNMPERQVVIELNGELIPRGNWGETRLSAEAVIEILRFVGGG